VRPERDAEVALRQAFETRAAAVSVAPDALGTIRERVERRRRTRRRLTVGLASLGTAAIAGAVTLILVLGGGAPVVTPTPPIGPATVNPSPSTATTPAGVAVSVPVYYVAPVQGQPRLYREFHPATVAQDTTAERMLAAVRLAVAGAPFDPDYATAWPGGTTASSVAVSAGVATVDVSQPGDETALQQLVWTITAVAADRGTQLSAVRVTVSGTPFGGDRVRAAAADVLAPVWLISPQQGAAVTGSFDVHLAGIVFEATVRLRVRDAGGAIVDDQSVVLSAGAPAQGEAHVTLTLPPGQYTIEAFYVSARDGSEQGLDGHVITVS
jgi:hypothetical protein